MIKSFRDLPVGAIFRALKSEFIGAYIGHQREVKSVGLHVKIGNSHSLKVEKIHNGRVETGKDVIFAMGMPCREEKMRVDVSKLPDWAIVNKGKPK